MTLFHLLQLSQQYRLLYTYKSLYLTAAFQAIQAIQRGTISLDSSLTLPFFSTIRYAYSKSRGVVVVPPWSCGYKLGPDRTQNDIMEISQKVKENWEGHEWLEHAENDLGQLTMKRLVAEGK
jgi:hypothetical protein